MTYFLNGGNPGGGNAYPGATQTEIGAALTFIRDQMLDAVSGKGWQIGDVDDIPGSLIFTIDGTGTENNKIRMEISGEAFSAPGSSNHLISVRVRDLDSAGTLANSEVDWSPALKVSFEDGNTNKIFMAIEEDAIVLCTIPASGMSGSLYAGYCDRLDTSDNMAIYMGHPITYGDVPGTTNSNVQLSGMERTYIAKRFEDEGEWKKIAQNVVPGIGYQNNTYSNLINHHDPMDLRWYSNANWNSTVNNYNISRGTHLGSGNAYSNKPILMPFFNIETGYKRNGTYSSHSEYSSTSYPGTVQLACRGYIKNVVRGLAYAGAGVQWQTESGEIYMSTGAGGWHGMRIA